MDVPLKLTSYNLQEVAKQLILHLMTNYPNLGRKELADQLGVSERTLYRYMNDFELKLPRKKDVPAEVREKVKYITKHFPNMKRHELAFLLLQHHNVSEQTIDHWLDRLLVGRELKTDKI